MKRGLVFGKFMPLHRGHQLLIETALSQVDDLTIVVYDSTPPGSYPRMPLAKRLGWLAALYPDVEAIVPVPDPHRNDADRDDPKYAQEYAVALAHLGQFDYVFTSEGGYEDFVRHLGAGHVVVDEARDLIPISGTQIRENVYEHRGWLDPLVYSSLVEKAVFVGSESTGKSTIAQELASRHNTLWTHEFGRELWAEQDNTGSFADHLKMARRQVQREEAARRHAREILFCDTNAWTTLQWCLLVHGTADPRLVELVEQTIGDYTWFLCDNDIPWEDDGQRELGPSRSHAFQSSQYEDLRQRGVVFTVLRGTLEQRVEQVESRLWLPDKRGMRTR